MIVARVHSASALHRLETTHRHQRYFETVNTKVDVIFGFDNNVPTLIASVICIFESHKYSSAELGDPNHQVPIEMRRHGQPSHSR